MSAMEQINTGIKLSGGNWNLWKFQMQVIFKSKGLWDIVSGTIDRPSQNTSEWDRSDAKAQEILVLKIEK